MDESPKTMSAGDVVTVLGAHLTVAPACEQNDNGTWACVAHSETFRNNFDKDSHLSARDDGRDCLFVWLCRTHGPEQP